MIKVEFLKINNPRFKLIEDPDQDEFLKKFKKAGEARGSFLGPMTNYRNFVDEEKFEATKGIFLKALVKVEGVTEDDKT